MGNWFIIGISGVSCAGKTSLANNLGAILAAAAAVTSSENDSPVVTRPMGSICQHEEAALNHLTDRLLQYNDTFRVGSADVVHQDDYFLPESLQTPMTGLSHMNWELITAIDMKQMCADIENILRAREEQMDCDDPSVWNILIIEGFTIFASPFVTELCNMKFHLHLPYEKCFRRRQKRVYSPADVEGYFEMAVWPMYENYFREHIDFRQDIQLLNGETAPLNLCAFVLTKFIDKLH